MCPRNRFIAAGVLTLLSFPFTAHAIPVSYSFTGELTWFTFDEGVQHRTLDSLSTRAITGVFSYDSERQDTSDISGLLRIAISGDGFFFDAGEEGLSIGAQSVRRDDTTTVDELRLFEFYEPMRDPWTLLTRESVLDLFGADLLNPGIGPVNSLLDVSKFEYGNGVFGGTDYSSLEQAVTHSIHGAFDVTSLSRQGTSVPEPGSLLLLGTGLALAVAARRRRPAITSPS